MRKYFTLSPCRCVVSILIFLILLSLVTKAQTVNVLKKTVYNRIELGKIFYQEGNFAEAITAFKQAVDIDPNNTDAHQWLITSAKKIKDKSSIQKFYQDRIKTHPWSAGYHYGMALYYLRLSSPPNKSLVCLELSKAFEVTPANSPLMQAIEKLANKENLYLGQKKENQWENFRLLTIKVLILAVIILLISKLLLKLITLPPHFEGILYIYDKENRKILCEDSRLKTSLLYKKQTIKIGSSFESDILLGNCPSLLATLIAIKWQNKNRVWFKKAEGVEPKLIVKDKKTEQLLKLPLSDGLLWDRDLIEIGEYKLEYLNLNAGKRPKKQIPEIPKEEAPAEVISHETTEPLKYPTLTAEEADYFEQYYEPDQSNSN